ncbi:MAG TPA: helix-turn-helix domain-containing protein [Thermoplasmata archaeon]|nr:helix-turn-helix domain-containing protein [Thermoplasmata archaeon]
MGPQAKQSIPGRRARSRRAERLRVRLNFSAYPVQASLGVLGRKWALLVLMNIALGRARRFNELLRSTPGMSKRVLVMRLNELERNGFIARSAQRPGYAVWQLTPKGTDVLPVLLTLIHFGSKWNPSGGPPGKAPPLLGREFEVVYRETAGSGAGGERTG